MFLLIILMFNKLNYYLLYFLYAKLFLDLLFKYLDLYVSAFLTSFLLLIVCLEFSSRFGFLFMIIIVYDLNQCYLINTQNQYCINILCFETINCHL